MGLIIKPGGMISAGGDGVPFPSFSGLRLWLRADLGVTTVGSEVSDWADQSGNAIDFAQSVASARPNLITGVINGHPVVRGDAIADFLVNATRAVVSGNASRTTFLVVDPKGVPAGQAMVADGHRGLNGNVYSMTGQTFVSTQGGFAGWAALPANQFSASAWNQNGTDVQDITLRIDKAASETRTSLTNVALNVVNAASAIMAQMSNPTTVFGAFSVSDIAEYVVYDRSLSSAEEDELFDYAASRYGI